MPHKFGTIMGIHFILDDDSNDAPYTGSRAYSVKYGKGGNKFGADFRIFETQMKFNEIA